jgi:hypothetical protein
MMPVIIFVTHVPVEWAIVLFSIAFFGQQSWSTLVMIVPTDLFDRRIVASVAGLVGFGGAMGGLVMNLAAGRLLDLGYSYQTVFSVVGTLHVIGFGVILLTIRIRSRGSSARPFRSPERLPRVYRCIRPGPRTNSDQVSGVLPDANPLPPCPVAASRPANFRHSWLG